MNSKEPNKCQFALILFLTVSDFFTYKLPMLSTLCRSITAKLDSYRLLLARLESICSLIWGAHAILGQDGGETLAYLTR